MAINWSEDQKRVIETRGADLLVSAAAGSGKTAVLVERIVRLICDEGVNFDELIVMTFTKDAAREMRERVEKALRERLAAAPSDQHLRLQLAAVPRARIATIDSICQTLIKQYYQYLDIDPNFRVADEGELRIIRSDVLSRLLEERYDQADEGFMRLADTFGRGADDKDIPELVKKLQEFAESRTFPERFLNAQLTESIEEAAGSCADSSWYKSVLQYIADAMDEYMELLETGLGICAEADGPAKYADTLQAELDIAENVKAAGSYEELYELLDRLEFPKLARITAKDGCDPAKKALVSDIRKDFETFIKKVLKDGLILLTPEELKLSVSGSALVNHAVISLTLDFMRAFEEEKRDKNIVDFADMEHLALKLLYEEQDGVMQPSGIADELARSLKEIMIDEYQDSNGVQDALLSALSAERFGRPDIFMVGDVKQSIYRFRQADPSIFTEKYYSYGSAGKNIKIELSSNYRSRAEVVDSVNAVFNKVMRRELGGVEYDEASRLNAKAEFTFVYDEEAEAKAAKVCTKTADNTSEPAATGIDAGKLSDNESALMPQDAAAEYEKTAEVPEEAADVNELHTGNPYKTELIIADAAKPGGEDSEDAPAAENGADNEAETEELKAKEIEFSMITARINELVNRKNPALSFKVQDKDTRQPRPARYSDIVVLMRAVKNNAELLAGILTEHGIPAEYEKKGGYFKSLEINIIMSLLNITDNPHQDIALAAVMRSPMYGFTDDELAMARAKYDSHLREQAEAEGSETVYAYDKNTVNEKNAVSEALTDSGDNVNKFNLQDVSRRDLWDAVRYCAAEDERFAAFTEDINRYRRLSQILPVHRLLSLMYDETGYYNYAAAMPAGEVRRGNLDRLLAMAESYAQTGLRGLCDFTRYVDALIEAEADTGGAADTVNEDSVRIMTIHGSKGLEFPIVFVTSAKIAKKGERDGIIADKAFGIASDYIDIDKGLRYPSIKKNIIQLRKTEEDIGEGLRLLYVAMTRAKEKLILSDTISSTKTAGLFSDRALLQAARGSMLAAYSESRRKLPKRSIMGCTQYMDLILMAAGEDRKAFDLRFYDRDMLVGQIKQTMSSELGLAARLCGIREAASENAAESDRSISLKKIFAARYAHETETKLKPKLSVSEIKMAAIEAHALETGAAFTAEHEEAEEHPAAAITSPAAELIETACASAAAEHTGKAVAAFTAEHAAKAGETFTAGNSAEAENRSRAEESFWRTLNEAEGENNGPAQHIGGALRGTAFHRALELADLNLSAEESLRKIRESGRMSEAELKALNKAAFTEFFSSELCRRMAEASAGGRLKREQHFMVGMPARELIASQASDELQLLQGIIDAYIEEEDGSISLIDYKTDKDVDEAELCARYAVQLELYARALTQLTGKNVREKIIYSTFMKRQIML